MTAEHPTERTELEIHLRGFILGVTAVRCGLTNGYWDRTTDVFVTSENVEGVYSRLAEQYGEKHADLFAEAAQLTEM